LQTENEEMKKLSSHQAYKTKIDALDLIIDVLREHEKTLDELVWRMNNAIEYLEAREYNSSANPKGKGPR
jgi:hypothetical protein